MSAITATARKLACMFYSLLKNGNEYVEKGMTERTFRTIGQVS